MVAPSVSVIIPVGPAERSLKPIMARLHHLNQADEIVFVFCPESEPLAEQLTNCTEPRIKSLVTARGRARQLNQGAQVAQGQFLWFLHLDSQFGDHQWQVLQQQLLQQPDRLHYFNLSFIKDGSGPLWLNSLGANLRSRVLQVPFGDQGFCISSAQFNRLRGYPEDVPYGEDHLFVWRAHRASVRLNNTGATLITSARKYAQTGWLKLTLLYQLYWIRQALPQLWLLLRGM